MNIKGVIISEKKYNRLTSTISKNVLENLYIKQDKRDNEISFLYNLSDRDVCRLRKIYDIKTKEQYREKRSDLRNEELTDFQKQFLHGTLLGDSAIGVQKSGNGYWICTHSIKQDKLLKFKAEIMKPFISKISNGWRPFIKGGKNFEFIRARSKTLPQFGVLRNKWYINDVKTITDEIIEELTPMGIAFWYFDDGSTTGYGYDITTFDKYFLDVEKSIEIFKNRFNLDISIKWRNTKCGNEGKIHILKKSHDLMWEYIKNLITPDIYYKIPFKYRDNQHPSLIRNDKEGSETSGSLNSNRA